MDQSFMSNNKILAEKCSISISHCTYGSLSLSNYIQILYWCYRSSTKDIYWKLEGPCVCLNAIMPCTLKCLTLVNLYLSKVNWRYVINNRSSANCNVATLVYTQLKSNNSVQNFILVSTFYHCISSFMGEIYSMGQTTNMSNIVSMMQIEFSLKYCC